MADKKIKEKKQKTAKPYVILIIVSLVLFLLSSVATILLHTQNIRASVSSLFVPEKVEQSFEVEADGNTAEQTTDVVPDNGGEAEASDNEGNDAEQTDKKNKKSKNKKGSEEKTEPAAEENSENGEPADNAEEEPAEEAAPKKMETVTFTYYSEFYDVDYRDEVTNKRYHYKDFNIYTFDKEGNKEYVDTKRAIRTEYYKGFKLNVWVLSLFENPVKVGMAWVDGISYTLIALSAVLLIIAIVLLVCFNNGVFEYAKAKRQFKKKKAAESESE